MFSIKFLIIFPNSYTIPGEQNVYKIILFFIDLPWYIPQVKVLKLIIKTENILYSV